MSTSQTTPSHASAPHSNRTLSPRTRARRLFEHLFNDPGLCVVCFATKRSFYPEYDQAVAGHLLGRNGTVLELMGHRLDDEGQLMVHKATSDADPNCYQEVVPPKTDEYGQIIEKATPRTICGCGVVDFDLDEDHRSKQQLYESVENIAEHVRERDEIDEAGFDLAAAKEVVRLATKRDSLAGRDRRVLIGAIELAIKSAGE